MTKHFYISEYCIHEDHDDCRMYCKICHAKCRCECHDNQSNVRQIYSLGGDSAPDAPFDWKAFEEFEEAVAA